MPGFWERPKVLCAILHCDNTSIAWAFGLRNLQIPGTVTGIAGMPYDHARNTACQIALREGYEWLFFLDSDVIPPNDAVLRLMSRNKPLISGVYCRRSPPHGIPVMIRNKQWVTNYRPNSIIEVDVVGAGCLLIHRSLLEQLPPQDANRGKHWFDWRVDMMGLLPEGEAMSEDFTFCLHARRALGAKVLVDTSVECRHVGLAQATLGRMDPCEAVA